MTASYPVFKRRLYRICRTAMSVRRASWVMPVYCMNLCSKTQDIVSKNLNGRVTRPRALMSSNQIRVLASFLRLTLNEIHLERVDCLWPRQYPCQAILGH